MSSSQHTLGHIPPCPGCLQHEVVLKTEIGRDLLYPEAAEQYIQSRTLGPQLAGSIRRAKYLRDHSLRDLKDYNRPLRRFFSMLKLCQIRPGNLKQYQFERSSGLLGPTRDDLFPFYVTRVARSLGKSKDWVMADAQAMALVDAHIDAHPEREVSPNRINQELGLLVRILKCAGVWTAEMEEGYEPLQHEESDIARALTPDEQQIFLEVASGKNPFIHQYALVGIDCVLRTKEEREIQIGDINLHSGSPVLMVRFRSTKNKYGIRTIPLSDQAVWAFERLIEDGKNKGCTQPQHFLFPFMEARGDYDPTRPMTVSGIKKPWDEVRIEAGLPWFTPYCLRHTGCTRYAEDGMPIPTLLSIAGHISRKMQEHYTRISEAAKRESMARTWKSSFAPVSASRSIPPARSRRG